MFMESVEYCIGVIFLSGIIILGVLRVISFFVARKREHLDLSRSFSERRIGRRS